ncbi:MAG: hypothetical protein GC190_00475 [Alphaproteobacteria bacterium]|nr:hypothetical protein [Alphaproteobacteria bacterium]
MHKLPVLATLSNAIAFVPLNLMTIVRLTWLPLLLIGLVQLAVSYWRLSEMIEMMQHFDPGSMFKVPTTQPLASLGWPVSVALYVLQLISIAVVAVALHRVILFNERKPGVWFSFPFGRTEFFYALMAVTALILVVVVGALLALPFVVVITPLGLTPEAYLQPQTWSMIAMSLAQKPHWFFVVALVVVYGGVIWLLLRLAAWPPTLVAEGGFGLARAWSLTRGNALRYLGLFLLVFVFFAAIGVAAYFFVAAQHISIMAWLLPTPVQADPNHPFGGVGQLFEWQRARLPYFAAAQLVGDMLAAAFGVALLSYGYKGVTGHNMAEPVTAAV